MDKKEKAVGNMMEVMNLRKNFYLKKKEIQVLKGLDLTVRRGEKVVITGKSGSGKSTLINLLAGLEPPTSGEIVFDGKLLNGLSNNEMSALRHRRTGIIFQNFNLLPSWNACENVEAVLFFSELPRDKRRKRAVELLNGVGLGDRLDNLPAELSMGQQQRVAVARALANEPEIIFADEPTGDVDPETAGEITKILFSWIGQRNTTLVTVTHGELPLGLFDTVYSLRDGILRK